MTNPIATAIAPQREAAVNYAADYTREQLMKFSEQFPVGSDLNVTAPDGNSWKDGKVAYRTKRARRALARRIVNIAEKFCRCPGDAEIVTGVDLVGIERLVEESKVEAAVSFDAYVAKLTAKVGDCDAATVQGVLWSRSVLTVTKGATVERWNTQQIVNFSVYGKAFNQWPTRLQK